MECIERVSQLDSQTLCEVTGFLNDQNIVVTENDLKIATRVFILRDEHDALVGTGSRTDNVIKYVAVCKRDTTAGTRFNQIVSTILTDLAHDGVFHSFVFTKPEYEISFQHVGFKTLAVADQGVLLEHGVPNLANYLQTIPSVPAATTVGSVVMNANPFTLGHRALVSYAARHNDYVYVFVVSADTSLFTTQERVALVKAGLSDIDNVIVVEGGDYMVSYLTFPAYFIHDTAEIVKYQTTLDANLFKQSIAKPLHITSRYLGTEPTSQTTAQYNQTLQAVLEPEINTVIMPRKTTQMDNVISASKVRAAIVANDLTSVETMVPDTTFTFIQAHLDDLQSRIKKGSHI